MFDTIIVGAGMAGLTTAIYLARAGKNVLVLEAKVVGGQIINTFEVENWPGDFKVSGADLMTKVSEQAVSLGAKLEYEAVVNIAKNDDLFTVATDESEYIAKTVVLAMGTNPRKLSDFQKESAGDRPISYCATCDGALYKGRPVVVIGSGNTAMQEIMYLEGICSRVYHIHHDDPIPDEAEAVFVAIGRVPVTDTVRELVELDKDGYVVAGEDCVTSCPGVFVAGDCRTKSVRQLVTASGDGAVASEQVVEYLSK